MASNSQGGRWMGYQTTYRMNSAPIVRVRGPSQGAGIAVVSALELRGTDDQCSAPRLPGGETNCP